MRRTLITIALTFVSSIAILASANDSIPSGYFNNLQWHLGCEATFGYVPGTNKFLRGENLYSAKITNKVAGDIRAGFNFAEDSREGVLYKGIYQGIGIGGNSFFRPSLIGLPVSVYVYQGAPIVHINQKLWLGYEWKFGAAFGWKHSKDEIDNNLSVSTAVTAMMGLSLKLNYSITDKVALWLGAEATHYSNGNTSWPNGGINSIGATIGAVYTFDPQAKTSIYTKSLEEEADRGRWLYDIMAFGAWRKRALNIGNPPIPEMCPGKFGVLGFQVSALRTLNRWVAVGPSLDLQWDESAGLAPYWVEGTHDSYIKFERPPFRKQIMTGISAHAELTTPIFGINAGLGYDFINPKGNKHFYQSLTLKTFVTQHLYLNVGYRLGAFAYPQNLMLGVGVRLW